MEQAEATRQRLGILKKAKEEQIAKPLILVLFLLFLCCKICF
jgi:hypothetical protein